VLAAGFTTGMVPHTISEWFRPSASAIGIVYAAAVSAFAVGAAERVADFNYGWSPIEIYSRVLTLLPVVWFLFPDARHQPAHAQRGDLKRWTAKLALKAYSSAAVYRAHCAAAGTTVIVTHQVAHVVMPVSVNCYQRRSSAWRGSRAASASDFGLSPIAIEAGAYTLNIA
jgi:hypothetical protein